MPGSLEIFLNSLIDARPPPRHIVCAAYARLFVMAEFMLCWLYLDAVLLQIVSACSWYTLTDDF